MNVQNFYDGMEQLSSFFGKRLSQQQQDLYFEELKYIIKGSFDHAVKSIQRGRKPNPGNFPTIEEIQAICPKQKSDYGYRNGETEEQYSKRITIADLWKALDVLIKKGNDEFMEHGRRMHFSEDDIDRVQCKYSVAYRNEIKADLKNFPKIDHSKRISELRNQAQELTGDIPF